MITKNIKKSFIIIIAILIFLLNQKSYGQNTIETDINNFLSEKQKEFMYLIIKKDLTSYISKKPTRIIHAGIYKQDIIITSASELFKNYHENEISADDIYRNKKVILRGIITDINRGIGEQYYIRFVLPDQFSSIIAFFDTKHKEHLAKLKRNQQYLVFCTCDGMSMGSPTLKQCEPINNWIEKESIRILSDSYFYLKNFNNINDIIIKNEKEVEKVFLYFLFVIKIKTDIEVEKLISLYPQALKDNKKATEFLDLLFGEKEENIIKKAIANTDDIKSLDILQKIELIKQEREKILSGDSNSN